ncbi:bacillithiol biosynthesis cysteine-adding enzyme BshC [Halobacillus halophilus]|uniref:Putative cysteine ligase BshC n=1 Tax=Halobacillus halophilus (strain ATCC 35676 / DSM 2266 / JCM 20832 / KCTC 3685 / LMG 17431 / NBRC 102448 / NCIMB 2269) TaxID=866895 RepID=I0JM44_HALH3|nr:bacillithiol biosynthesis cysteine-adding enzyme BshC [Halobacillus halophilus]ASF39306.1 bacillithiol biosynthesis cysteine-adding enzyme BshC [Halobacillus halophilus]CCG45214.1 hypothetical protein HBHAL_2866 [Halobacillus halophilus DSM 2266]
MRIDPIQLKPKQRLFHDYKYNFENVKDKFSYEPGDPEAWEKRLQFLQGQTYQRSNLSEVLKEMNERWGAPESTLDNIERLKDENATVVIAGQQAGLLTGPLYTVHKIISVLQLAKKKEAELGKPVLPVFWIAGEDHDFDEINHIMVNSHGRMKKMAISQEPDRKASVSDIKIDQRAGEEWLKQIFSEIDETEYTGDFYQQTLRLLEQSESYSDFFAQLVYLLFPDEGLVVMDAHRPEVRKLESAYFTSMIKHNAEIAHRVFSSIQLNAQEGYETVLESEAEDAHLFYHHEGERVLLTREKDGSFRGKQNEFLLSEQELLEIAEHHPECLSNNVVSRPLMQDFLFPVLAFIGGPGEINYWSVLKPGFEAVGLQMPPVLPRLSFTLVDRKAEQELKHFHVEPQEAVQFGTGEKKMRWIASKSAPPIPQLSAQVKEEIERIHKPLREKSAELGPDLEGLADKNLHYIYQHVDYLEKRMAKTLEEKYEKEVTQFNELDLLLHPAGGLQERMWSILPWVNQQGTDVFQRLNQHLLTFDQDHYVVYV